MINNKVVKKKTLENPIIDGRIVGDMTFAKRLVGFLDDIKTSDQVGEEELEYLKDVAARLLVYQMATAEDKDELGYFKNLGYKL